MLKYLAIIFLVSCSHSEEKKPKGDKELLELARDKASLYLDLGVEVKDDGFILTDECDSLLHTGLYIASGGGEFSDLLRARDDDGRWWRRPARDCLKNGKSKSSISRDMLLGVMLATWSARDLATAEALVEYGEQNNWVYGEHDGSITGKNRVFATPSFQSLLYQLRETLGGAAHGKAQVPQDYTPFKKGFERHLAALTILLRGMMHKKITQIEANTIKDYLGDDPNNALFRAIASRFDDGDQSESAQILLREDLFPADRLPTSSERCNAYLWMHGEKPSDWDPCDKGHIHPGHDLVFAAWVLGTDSFGITSE